MPKMGAVLLELSLATAAIYFACEYFTNGVEWLGRRLNLSQTATGTLLAAFGTALPESVVTLSAAAFGSDAAQKDIGVGAAIGGPLALSTIGYGVIGLMIWRRRSFASPLGGLPLDWLRRDQIWFLCVFVVTTLLGVAGLPWKAPFGLLLIAAYAIYFHRGLDTAEGASEALVPDRLALCPRDPEPKTIWIALQLGLALATIFIASRFFVQRLEMTGSALGLSPQVTALLLSPIATEMPETMNAIVWMRQDKAALALANVSGAMMIQATLPAAFGMIFTPWLFEAPVLIAALAVLLATTGALTVANMRRVALAG
jgi:cation:H+ antiporter